MISALLFIAAVASALTEQEYEDQFVNWMLANAKTYTTEEFFSRYDIFKKNVDLINEHNSGKHSYTLGLTSFADLTQDEFQAKYLGGLSG